MKFRHILGVIPAALAALAAHASYPAWQADTTYTAGTIVSYQGYDYQAAVTQTDYSSTGWNPTNASLWTVIGADSGGATPTPTAKPTTAPTATPKPTSAPTSTPKPTTAPTATPKPTVAPTATPVPTSVPTVTPTPTAGPTPVPGGSSGTISFHLLIGPNTPQDTLNLAGDTYTDLIMSNIIAGVMYGHLVSSYYPGIQYNKDYLYGSVLAQLLQENLDTEEYDPTTGLIDTNPNQQAVMSTGQGGPYQINNYLADMVNGSFTPTGYALVNFIALQKNIGYTIANNASMTTQVTPPMFNNKYYGPMLTAYFHYNDFVAMQLIGKGPGGWKTPWEPDYDNALVNFKSLPNNFLDIILNAAYNQGYYGGLCASYSTKGASATAATVASINNYSSIWGDTNTYDNYPYQVHYYLDQFYNNPIPVGTLSNLVTPNNHVIFNMALLNTVFTNVFQTLGYSNGTAASQLISASQAQAAFASALATTKVSSAAALDLSNANDRATIFTLLETAIGNLEASIGMKFGATSTTQL